MCLNREYAMQYFIPGILVLLVVLTSPASSQDAQTSSPSVSESEAAAFDAMRDAIESIQEQYPDAFSDGVISYSYTSACGGSVSDPCPFCYQRFICSGGNCSCTVDSYCADTNC